jgi:hypothetical protein
MNSIKLSTKHGVNPSMVTCFWCGEERGEVALVGRMKDDEKAPRHICLDYEPCEACKEKFSKGVAIIEASDTAPKEGMVGVRCSGSLEVYPTGRWMVFADDAIKKMFKEPGEILDARQCFMDMEAFTMMMSLTDPGDADASTKH